MTRSIVKPLMDRLWIGELGATEFLTEVNVRLSHLESAMPARACPSQMEDMGAGVATSEPRALANHPPGDTRDT